MKRTHGVVIALVVASCIWPNAAKSDLPKPHVTAAKPNAKATSAAQAQTAKKQAARRAAMVLLAPADEYFGPLKQSILGIRNSLRDMNLHYQSNPAIGPQTVASAALTEAAIREWARKYPRDHEVAVAIFTLQRLYAKIETEPARAKAKATANWLLNAYVGSPQAKSLREILVGEQSPQNLQSSATAPPAVVPAVPAPDTLPSTTPF